MRDYIELTYVCGASYEDMAPIEITIKSPTCIDIYQYKNLVETFARSIGYQEKNIKEAFTDEDI